MVPPCHVTVALLSGKSCVVPLAPSLPELRETAQEQLRAQSLGTSPCCLLLMVLVLVVMGGACNEWLVVGNASKKPLAATEEDCPLKVATYAAFAALRRDGRVVAWGEADSGGDARLVQERKAGGKRWDFRWIFYG
eukprot:Skav200615  [mRNA]  locus=scaffold2873:47091:52997:- [translate_table: standard]